MRAAFGHWKYIVKNIWFVLPFAIVPAVFLALSLNYEGIGAFVEGFFAGNPRLEFLEYLKVFSIIRFDEVLGGIFSALAFVCVVLFASVLLVFIEKHMRIGKRTVSGLFSQLGRVLGYCALIFLLYLVIYEIWAIILSALLFGAACVQATGLAYALQIVAILALGFVLLYITTIFYLWIPCLQATGFNAYHAFVYSYRLMMGVRWQLVLAFVTSFLVSFVAIGGLSQTPGVVFRLVSFALFVILFMSFTVRMEEAYFTTDRLDREDLLHSYRGY